MKAILAFLVFNSAILSIVAAPLHIIKVHFLYGSKPKSEFKTTEPRWFGGIHGGHVGIEFEANKVFHFEKKGKLRLFPKPRCSGNSQFSVHSLDSFYAHFGTGSSKVKKTTFSIPIDKGQYQKLLATIQLYLEKPPYNYAFFGMRCASAMHDVLEQLEVFRKRPHALTSMRIMYPKRLRNRLFKKAYQMNWEYWTEAGSERRKWEKDPCRFETEF